MQVSGSGVGWEQIGESTDDLTGDLSGSMTAGCTGELMGDLVVELGRGEAGALTGEAETGARVGEGREEGSWTGTGEGHSGLLAAGGGEGVVLSAGFVSSGKYGSGKKRVPGDFTRIISVSGSGDGLSGERTTSSFCTR